ncbi:MAG: flagellar hook protein FlgE [Bryobacteraceae bacterium]
MLNSFVSALSALRANGTAVDAVGNNLANLSTVGFKKSSVNFRDVVGDVLSGSGTTQVGSGVAQPFTPRQFTQGSIQTTGGHLDAAIQGDGFFILRKEAGSGTSTSTAGRFYTRAGDFKVDESGRLVSQSGELVQGWSLNTAQNAINTSDPIGDIVVPVGSSRSARATSSMSVDLNLDGSASTGSQFAVPVEIYDSLGNSHTLTVTYSKTANPGEWDVNFSLPATDGTVTFTTAQVTFDPNGKLQTVPDGPPPGSFSGIDIQFNNPAVNGIPNLTYSLWGTVPTGIDPGVPRITQFSQPSAPSAIKQDGVAAALLTGVTLDDGGSVMAEYSNGDRQEVARLALASIRNPDSLVATGNNNLKLGSDTATPTVGEANTGGRGAIVSLSLESSNVDIAEEFTKLIVYQRGYQANARVITTSDEISQETINLKR